MHKFNAPHDAVHALKAGEEVMADPASISCPSAPEDLSARIVLDVIPAANVTVRVYAVRAGGEDATSAQPTSAPPSLQTMQPLSTVADVWQPLALLRWLLRAKPDIWSLAALASVCCWGAMQVQEVMGQR